MDNVLAKVGPLTVTEAEVDEFLLSLGQRGGGYNNPQGRKLILEQLIGNKLLLLDAKRNLVEADPEFKAELARVKDSLLVNFVASKTVSAVKITDDEIKAYYEENKAQFVSGKSVNASHILVNEEVLAKEILEKINNGTINFEDAAKQYSTCPSKENGGSLGDFTEGQMVPEFDKAVFAMQVGEITSEPVKTQFGYHLIKLNSKKDSEQTPFEEVKTQISEMLLNEKRHKAYESKINQLKIMYPVDIVG